MAFSKQGVHIAFIGLDEYAQTACSEYLKRKLDFKRMDLDDGLRHFLRTVYGYHSRLKLKRREITGFYDSIYKVDNDIWITQFTRNFLKSEADVTVSNVRYLNELRALQELGFKVCRVTSTPKNRKNISLYVRTAEKGTVALSMLYDKSFASNYNVDYSVNFTNYPNLPSIMDPLLEDMGYKFDI